MSRKKLLVLLAIICLALILQSAVLNLSPNPGRGNTDQTPTQNSPPEGTTTPELVVPEAPLGTLGMFSVLALSLSAFILTRRKR